jgi:hypothetical protein
MHAMETERLYLRRFEDTDCDAYYRRIYTDSEVMRTLPAGKPMAREDFDSRLTKHHLIPRTRNENKKNKKDFTRDEVRSRLVDLCRPCHRQVHTVLTNKELERDYNTSEALRGHPDIMQFCAWLARRPAGTLV